MQERGAAAVLGKPADPAGNPVSVEGSIGPSATGPWLAKAVVGFG
jgi:hypothetical protein